MHQVQCWCSKADELLEEGPAAADGCCCRCHCHSHCQCQGGHGEMAHLPLAPAGIQAIHMLPSRRTSKTLFYQNLAIVLADYGARLDIDNDNDNDNNNNNTSAAPRPSSSLSSS
ncbi:hypothetical protein Tco_1546701 [Tanacetum coccineum]